MASCTTGLYTVYFNVIYRMVWCSTGLCSVCFVVIDIVTQVTGWLQNGTAYHCFCSPKRLDLLRRDAVRRGETPRYDNRCRHLQPEEVKDKLASKTPYVIRLKVQAYLAVLVFALQLAGSFRVGWDFACAAVFHHVHTWGYMPPPETSHDF